MRKPPRPKLSILSAAVLSTLAAAARAQELPVACGAGTCGIAGPAAWVTSGHATATFTANTLAVQQTTDEVVLNWQSFNVSADGTVTFTQPSADAIALNRIFQADPSRIFGALNANGRVFLHQPERHRVRRRRHRERRRLARLDARHDAGSVRKRNRRRDQRPHRAKQPCVSCLRERQPERAGRRRERGLDRDIRGRPGARVRADDRAARLDHDTRRANAARGRHDGVSRRQQRREPARAARRGGCRERARELRDERSCRRQRARRCRGSDRRRAGQRDARGPGRESERPSLSDDIGSPERQHPFASTHGQHRVGWCGGSARRGWRRAHARSPVADRGRAERRCNGHNGRRERAAALAHLASRRGHRDLGVEPRDGDRRGHRSQGAAGPSDDDVRANGRHFDPCVRRREPCLRRARRGARRVGRRSRSPNGAQRAARRAARQPTARQPRAARRPSARPGRLRRHPPLGHTRRRHGMARYAARRCERRHLDDCALGRGAQLARRRHRAPVAG